MFLNQYVYYNNGIDTIPVQIVKCSPKTLLVRDDENTVKRVKKTSCSYQDCGGGYIDVNRLERLLKSNSNDIPKKWIMQDDLCNFDSGIGIIRERKATANDYRIYPQVIMKEFL
jgi:hypothetical protein